MMRAYGLMGVLVVLFLAAGTASAQSDGSTWAGQEPGNKSEAGNVQDAIDLIVRENAGKREIEYKNFVISFGASFLNAFNTEIRVDNTKVLGIGTRLRLEDDLGFDSSSQVFRVDAAYNFNRYHRIDVSWFDIKRDSTTKTDEEIIWDDIVIPPTKVDLHFNTAIFKIAYRYNFIVRDDWDIGFGIGVHWMQLDTGIRIVQDGGADPDFELDADEQVEQGLPLPLIGLHGNFAPSNDWRIFVSIEAMWAKLGDYSGRVMDLRMGVDWMFIDWMGVGLYYNFFSLDVEAKSDDWRGEAEYSYQGLILSLNFAF